MDQKDLQVWPWQIGQSRSLRDTAVVSFETTAIIHIRLIDADHGFASAQCPGQNSAMRA